MMASDAQIQLLLPDSKANHHARGRGDTQQVSDIKSATTDCVALTLGIRRYAH